MVDSTPIYIAAIIFSLVALIQFVRMAMGWTIVINGVTIPLWVSAIVFLLTAGMAWWLIACCT
jgi:hypothetical protein